MNQITLRIGFTDNTDLEVQSAAIDIVKFETHFDLSVTELSKQTHLLYLAWLAVSRLGKTGLEFEKWLESVANVEVADPKE